MLELLFLLRNKIFSSSFLLHLKMSRMPNAANLMV